MFDNTLISPTPFFCIYSTHCLHITPNHTVQSRTKSYYNKQGIFNAYVDTGNIIVDIFSQIYKQILTNKYNCYDNIIVYPVCTGACKTSLKCFWAARAISVKKLSTLHRRYRILSILFRPGYRLRRRI